MHLDVCLSRESECLLFLKLPRFQDSTLSNKSFQQGDCAAALPLAKASNAEYFLGRGKRAE